MNRPDSIVWTVNQPHEAFHTPSSPKSPNFDSLARQLRRQISENFDTSPIKSSYILQWVSTVEMRSVIVYDVTVH